MTQSTARPEVPDGFVMPDLGDRAPVAGTASTPGPVGSGAPRAVSDGPRKMAFICSKGNLDMAYPALIMGNAALGEGVEVDVFFTFWGLDIINPTLNDDLRFSFVGNTAMHLPDLMSAAGAHFWACRLTFGMMKVIEADLHPGVEGVISASDFIEISDGAQIVFV